MPTVLRAVSEPRADVRPAYWRHVLSTRFAGLDVRFDRSPDYRDQIFIGSVGPLEVLSVRNGPGAAARTSLHIRRHDPDRFMLYVQTEGTTDGEHFGRSAEYRSGDLGLVDLSQPLRCYYRDRRAVMVSYPKSLSPFRSDEVARLAGTRIPGESRTIGLVSHLIRQLPRHLDVDDGAGGARIGAAVLDLLHVGLAAELGRERSIAPEAHSRALILRCRAFIERHLSDPALTPEAVASAHYVSLRHLHRVFQPTGESVASLIRRRRLEQTRRDLLDPRLVGRPVNAVGARWGFADAAHFSRAFKRAYGLPPAAYRYEHAS